MRKVVQFVGTLVKSSNKIKDYHLTTTMKRIYSTVIAIGLGVGTLFAQDLSLTGVIDFTVPEAGSAGKAIHVTATADIADLSMYGIGVANNGGGTDGEEYTFPAISVMNGDDILVVRDSQAMANYFAGCFGEFDVVLVDAGGGISQNGDDAIELFQSGTVVETYGDPDVDGTGESWEYQDAWAHKDGSGTWTTATPNCTDNTTTIYDADCRYPVCPDLMIESITVEGEGGVDTIDVMGGTLQMTAMISPDNADDTTFMWSVNDDALATIDANGLLTAKANGTVTVTATANDAGGVTGSADITLTNQRSVGIVNELMTSLKVYPNPAEKNITVDVEGTIKAINIYTLDGKVIDAPVNRNRVNVQNLVPGSYFIEVQTESSTLRSRFSKN